MALRASMLRAFLDGQPCSKAGGLAAPAPGRPCVLAASATRCWHGSAARGQRGLQAQVLAAASRHVAQSASVVERTVDMPADETLQLSAESERRRRSLEASYDAEATPDMLNEARTQQVHFFAKRTL